MSIYDLQGNKTRLVYAKNSACRLLGDKHYKYKTVYSADIAEGKYRMGLTTHGPALKIGNDYEFVRYMEEQVIKRKHSPCAVLGRIKREKLPFRTNISKTTLYRYIRQGIFANITMDNVNLKRKHYQKAVIKRPPKGTSIEKRPADVLERTCFGHWEMDCVLGKTLETLLTFTERLTRKEIIIKLPNKKNESVVKALDTLERKHGKRFRKIFKSITVDNSVEFADCAGMERSIYGKNEKRTKFYYCHPYTSCERGTNERLNREVRRKFPKGTSFKKITIQEIKFAEEWINNYPRQIFGFATSEELYQAQIAKI